MTLFLEGLLIGAPAIFFMGPVLLTLLQASIKHGFRAGFAVASGIAFSDVVCVALCYVGVAQFMTSPTNQRIMGIAGAIILAGFGVASMLSKPKPQAEVKTITSRDFVGLFVQGFLVNFVNPFVFAYWIGALGVVSNRHGLNPWVVSLMFGGAITTIYVTDTLKALFAARMKHYLQSSALLWLNRGMGFLLVLGGGYLLWRVL
ncbi:MAG: hypothetical protein EP343_11310 [Deltaproteobacteria bacterium]|nr:MAG: hypothetical protein EP343_11310 [Deltaproteobacteria bacterium]